MPKVADVQTQQPDLLARFEGLAATINSSLTDAHVQQAERLQRINELKDEVAALEEEQRTMPARLQQAAIEAAQSGNFDALDTVQQRAARLPLLLKGARVAVLRAQIDNQQQHKAVVAPLAQQGRLSMIELVDLFVKTQRQRERTAAAVNAARSEQMNAAQQERALQTALDTLLKGKAE